MTIDDDYKGPVIRVWPSSAQAGGAVAQRSAAVVTASPVVRRYNHWGYWEPLRLNTFAFDEGSFHERELSAAVWYRQQTGCAGLEFVAITTNYDEAPFRTLAGGALIVPVVDPDWPRRSMPMPPYYLYDGWCPVDEEGPDAIRDSLARLEDSLDFFAYQHGVKLRLVVKYTELFGADLTTGVRETDSRDDALFRDRLSRLLDLPAAIQTAIRRAAHWQQNHERQHRKTDQFLALWLALESLALVLYQHCGPVGLVVLREEAGMTKAQRQTLCDKRVEEVLAREVGQPASERVSTAYFEGVKGIRRQVEAVLKAVFESEEHGSWLYTKSSTPSPATLRSKLVHEGWSESEAVSTCPLGEYIRRLDSLLRELIERVLLRQWGGRCELPFRGYSRSLLGENALVSPTAQVDGDFRISLGLLLRKEVIDIV